jgi:hypothetical protein
MYSFACCAETPSCSASALAPCPANVAKLTTAELALLVGQLVLGHLEHCGRREPMQAGSAAERLGEGRVLRQVGEDVQPELVEVDRQEHPRGVHVIHPSRPCVATGEIHADTQAPHPERIEENEEKRESPSRALDRSAGTESIFEATLSHNDDGAKPSEDEPSLRAHLGRRVVPCVP